MLVNKKSIFLIFILLFNFSFIYAAEEFGCCYSPSSNSFGYGICESNLILSGVNSNTCEQNNDALINEGLIQRQVCVENSVELSDKIRYINSNDGTIYAPNDDTGSCSGSWEDPSNPSSGGNINVNSGDEETQSGFDDVLRDLENLDYDFDRTAYNHPNEEIFNICAGSDITSVFMTESICESQSRDDIESTSGNCLYNPNKAGIFSSNLNRNFEDEVSCVPKQSIKSCYMYKTKNNCEENPSKDISSSNELQYGCSWVDNQQYSEGIFKDEGGTCVSNYDTSTDSFDVGEDDYYNYFYYERRTGNLINDSTFQLSSNPNIETDLLSPYGQRVYNLNSNEEITFSVDKVASSNNYFFSTYIKVNEDEITSDDNIRITYRYYDEDGNPIDTYSPLATNILDFQQNESLNEIYSRLVFDSTTTPVGTSIVSVTMSSSIDILIDFVSFQRTPSSTIDLRESLLTAVMEIPQEASNCQVCYETLGINLCTQTKSDMLGDCSYMVNETGKNYSSKLDFYLGNKDNDFMSSTQELKNWQSQSLANTNLFCEMYTIENQCVDSSNYVNSKYSNLHPQSGGTLCSWNDNYGCFKDSNDDNLPDTINLTPSFSESFSGNINEYNFSSNEGISDFQLACDVVPPYSNVYLRGVNSSGGIEIITSDSTTSLGNISVFVDVSDQSLDKCRQFEAFSRDLYVHLSINEDEHIFYEKLPKSQLIPKFISLDNLFRENWEDIDNVLNDGSNTFEITFKDQSGNYGKPWNFDFDGDFSGPEIELVNFPNKIRPNGLYYLGEDRNNQITLGPNNKFFNFTINDHSTIESCEYTLIPSGNVDNNFYSNFGNFEFETDSNEQLIEFELPINDSSLVGDTYLLTLNCKDMFNQESEYNVTFDIDLNTDFTLISPLPYTGENSFNGYISQDTFNIQAASVADNLNSCYIEFDTGEGADFSLTPQEFVHNEINYNTNLTAEITFNEPQGLKNGTIVCEDTLGNVFQDNVEYVFDKSIPSIELLELRSSNSNTNVVEIDGDWYIWANNPSSNFLRNHIKLDFNISNTYSNLYNISYEIFNVEERIYKDNRQAGDIDSQSNIENNNFLLSLSNSLPDLNILAGEEIEENLFKNNLKYNFTFLSKSSTNFELEYFRDSSNPSISFSGENLNQVGDTIYFQENDPNIQINFNSPEYRQFSCDISASQRGSSFGPLSFSNVTEFRVSQISSTINTQNTFSLELECVDLFDHKISKNIDLKQDTTSPELLELNLEQKLNKYYLHGQNKNYEPYIDNVEFNLKNTGEDGYKCNYKFEEMDKYYICDSEFISQEFSESGFQLSDDADILFNSDSTCQTTPAFKSEINDRSEITRTNTKIKLIGYCEDLAGLQTQTLERVINVDYVNSQLVELNFRYENGMAYPTFVFLENLGELDFEISTQGNKENPFFNFSTSSEQVGANFHYTSEFGIDLDRYEEGTLTIRGAALDQEEEIASIISNIIVDRAAPELTMDLSPMKGNNLIGEQGIIDLESYDFGSGISKIELKLTDLPIMTYYSNGTVSYNDTYLEDPSISSSFINDGENFQSTLSLINLTIGEEYNLVVSSYDNGGNMVEENIRFGVEDGVVLTLLSSENTFVGSAGQRNTWFTNSSQPFLRFETSEPVTTCSIYPFDDSQWRSKGIQNTGENLGSGSSFEFDLSSQEDFVLSNSDIFYTKIKLQCIHEGETFNFSQDLRLYSLIPDYVLSSTNGFVLTQEPYTTSIEVNAVTPFKYLTCGYELNGEDSRFTQENVGSFREELDFSSFTKNQVYDLTLSCVDALGNEGPEKSYQFSVENPPLDLSELKFTSGDFIQEPDSSDIIYLSTDKQYSMSFLLNKKDDTSCQYYSTTVGGTLNGFFNFFKNLLDLNRRNDLELSTNPFLYEINNIEFSSAGSSDLVIECETANEKRTFEYEIQSIDPRSESFSPAISVNN